MNWARFDRYALRVRRLYHDESKRKYIDDSVWGDILRARPMPRVDLLPNLQSLLWHAVCSPRQHWSVLFVHGKVQRLSIQLHLSPSLPAYVESLLQRTCHFTELELKSEDPMRDLEPHVLPLLGCQTLQRVVAPMFFFTSTFFNRLSRCPELRTISLSKPVEQGVGDRMDVAFFSPGLEEDSFPVLERLSFSAHVLHATHFLRAKFSPRNISYLYINVIAVDGPQVVHELLSTVADTCKVLTELHVDFVISPDAPLIYPPPPLADRPNIEVFRPLFSCRSLTRFEFRWDYQMNVTQEDIEELASSWPSMEVFLFNCQPIPEDIYPILTLEALIPFAQYCPNLRELGLYLNALEIPSTFTYPNTSPLPAFKSLQKLSVGASCVSHVEPIALFLSQLCPLGCEIISGVRWPDAYGIALDQLGIMDHRRLKMTEWWVRWGDVSKVLPLATKARMEERGRMVEMKKKMDDFMSCLSGRATAGELQQELDNLRIRWGM